MVDLFDKSRCNALAKTFSGLIKENLIHVCARNSDNVEGGFNLIL
jgi:hypothetical protein